MSKKKKTTKTRRRRRVSGIGKNIPVQKLALGIVGAAAASKITEQMMKSTNETMQKAAPYVPLAAGIALPMFVKNDMVNDLSTGLVIGGGIAVLKELKVLSGFRQVRTINGYPNQYMRLPDRKSAAAAVNGLSRVSGQDYTTKSNFSGSRMSQMSVISGMENHDGSGCAMAV